MTKQQQALQNEYIEVIRPYIKDNEISKSYNNIIGSIEDLLSKNTPLTFNLIARGAYYTEGRARTYYKDLLLMATGEKQKTARQSATEIQQQLEDMKSEIRMLRESIEKLIAKMPN